MKQEGTSATPASKSKLLLGLNIATLAFGLDRICKWWLLDFVDMPSRLHISLMPFFDLVMVWNKGISFGLFSNSGLGHKWLLSAVSIVIVSVLIFWLQRTHDRLSALAFGLIIGGAVGNIYDRFAYGAVADFFDFHIGGYHWPAFNIADSAITIGVVLILLEAFLTREESQQ
jgi:signal peptidase II